MSDPIEKQAAIDALKVRATMNGRADGKSLTKLVAFKIVNDYADYVRKRIEALPPAQPEIVRCKDCKFYSPMNRETKTGICNLLMHQNFGDNWFCAGAERREE